MRHSDPLEKKLLPKHLRKRLIESTEREPRSGAYLIQRISIPIQRANAANYFGNPSHHIHKKSSIYKKYLHCLTIQYYLEV